MIEPPIKTDTTYLGFLQHTHILSAFHLPAPSNVVIK